MKIERIVESTQGDFEFSVVTGKSAIKCMVPSPFEVHTQIFTLPKVRKEHLFGSISIRLKSMYPGDLGECSIDYYRPYPVSEDTILSVTSFVASKKKTASAWATNAKIIPACSIAVAASEACERDIDFCIILTQKWMDIYRFEHEHPVSQVVSTVWRSHFLDDIIEENFCSKITETSRIEFVTLDDFSTREFKEIKSRGQCHLFEFSKSGRREIERLLELEIFKKAKKNPLLFSGKATVFLIAANVLFGGMWIGSTFLNNEKELTRLHAEYNQSTKKMAELITLRKRIQAEQSLTRDKNPVNIDYYAMIAQLSSCIGSAYIEALTINEYSFQLTAESADSIRVFTGISESRYFRNVVLVQSTQSNDKSEVFTITGEFAHDVK